MAAPYSIVVAIGLAVVLIVPELFRVSDELLSLRIMALLVKIEFLLVLETVPELFNTRTPLEPTEITASPVNAVLVFNWSVPELVIVLVPTPVE